MNNAAILSLNAAILAGVMGLGVLFIKRRSLAHFSFALGMIALAIESVFVFQINRHEGFLQQRRDARDDQRGVRSAERGARNNGSRYAIREKLCNTSGLN